MYKKLSLITALFILLLAGTILAEYPYSLNDGEDYVILLSFDNLRMAYTLTRIRVYEVEDDPTNPAAFAFNFFPINPPLQKIVKNINCYNYRTNEKLRFEYIENKDDLDSLINEILIKKDFPISEPKRKEVFKEGYDSLEDVFQCFL